ncbi:MAG: hypothetical protein EHM41_09600, partial [Chloroflexi bacterium]
MYNYPLRKGGGSMLEVRFLGQFEVIMDGKSLTIPTRNAQSLFAYLLLNAGKAQRREKLAGLLWPDSNEENARSNLRHELWRLRKAFAAKADAYFLIDDLTVAFNSKSDYSFDVLKLEKAPLENSTADDFIEAISAYRGELLPGFYEEWITVDRARLAALFGARITLLLDILQSEGRWADVVDWASRWIALGEWPEPAYRALITAYANRGDLSKAVAAYDGLAKGLQKELGIKPSEQTQELYKRLKAGWKVDPQKESQGQWKALPNGYLEDSATKSFSIPNLRRSNLPKPLTSFIGREKEIQEVKNLVSKGRLVTITGPGGVGKTRLAGQVGSEMIPQYRDGVWWIELASLFTISPPQKRSRSANLAKNRGRSFNELHSGPGDPIGYDLVLQAVAKVFRVQEIPGLSLLDGVIRNLKDKKLLLILDNCEHLVKACAYLAEQLLPECPDVIILTTSREALKVPGERVLLLPSLSLPEIEPASGYKSILQSEAVNLFIERVGDVLDSYSPSKDDMLTIAQICLQLDGIPLAIELASARMNMLSAREIADRLDSRFSLLTGGHRTALPRHHTLRAAIEWSYDLLDKEEQLLFRRLSIFASSFTMDAAETICASEEMPLEEILPVIGRLVNKSLLNVEPASQDLGLATRYRFLDTICSFGRLLLVDETDETWLLRKRHVEYYVSLVENTESELLLQNQGVWYRLLQAENDNIRAAIEWSVENNQAECALRIVGALLWYWWSHGSIREGRDLSFKVLDLPSTPLLVGYRGRALNTAAYLQWVLGDMVSARQLLQEALAHLKNTDDDTAKAMSMQFLGLVLNAEGEFEQADIALKEGITIAKKLGNLTKSSFSLAFLGDIALQQGDHQKAKQVYQECADQLRALGNKLFLAYPLRRLGYLALERDDPFSAWKYFRESLALNQEGNDKRAVTACLTSFAALALHINQPVTAARLYASVENKLESLMIDLLNLDRIELERVR